MADHGVFPCGVLICKGQVIFEGGIAQPNAETNMSSEHHKTGHAQGHQKILPPQIKWKYQEMQALQIIKDV